MSQACGRRFVGTEASLRPNQVVPSEWIVDELFRDAAVDPANALQVAISRLRRSLGDGVLETRPRGYFVNIDPEQLDSLRFERLAEEGRALGASGESERACADVRRGARVVAWLAAAGGGAVRLRTV